VAFQPDLPGGVPPGTPLQAKAGDLVGWNNRTPKYHQPWEANSSFQPIDDGALTNDIEPWQGSTAAYKVVKPATGTTIFYVCKAHPDEHGTIVVS